MNRLLPQGLRLCFPTERVLVFFALLLFSVFVATGVHGFSIGAWNFRHHVPDTIESYAFRQIGVARQIRSDEWCVSTPMVLAQCASPDFFPRVNKRVSGGTDMFMTTPCSPVWDWTVPGQFHNWGYFLFGAERGLAWNWWCRFLGIPLFAYLFFVRWLGRDRLLAGVAALAVTFGAPTQWWDTTLPYLLLYFFSGLVFLRFIVSAETKVLGKVFASVGLFVSLASYAFVGYPPFAILLFPAFLIFGWQTFFESAVSNNTRKGFLSTPWFWLAAVLFALIAEFTYFAVVHAETLRTISSSVYPGKRFVLGGSLTRFLRHQALDTVSLFLPWTGFKENVLLWNEANACQAARYFVPGIGMAVFLVFGWPTSIRLRRSDLVLFALCGWFFLWSAVPFPRWLAGATGMFLFPPHRTEVVGGFFLLLLLFRIFSQSRNLMPYRHRSAVLASVLSVAFLSASLLIPGGNSTFFASPRGILFLIGGAVLCAAVNYGFVARIRWLFCCGYAAVSLIGGATVHPLARGISPIVDKELASLVREVDSREPGRWMSNLWTTGNFLLAQGLDCEPGTQTYVHEDFWSVIDPQGIKMPRWNQYGHRFINLTKNEEPEVASSGDRIRFTVTESKLRALGITHLVWSHKKLHEPWLHYEGRSRRHFVYTLLPEKED